MDIKPQDILFFITLIGLVYLKRPRLFVAVGLLAFVISIPLFSLQIFFTAQRFVVYGASFLLFSLIIYLIKRK